jgi:hypothetical protein
MELGEDVGAQNSVEGEAIIFLQEEIEAHREFIERERQFLVWFLSVIGTLATGLIAFFGIQQHRDVERIIKGNYRKIIDRQIGDYVNHNIADEDQREYLKKLIEREKEISEAAILAIVQNDEPGAGLNIAYQQLEDNGQAGLKKISAEEFVKSDEYKKHKYKQCKIWIYEAGRGEPEEKADSPIRAKIREDCKKISDYCEAIGGFCIICVQHGVLKPDFLSDRSYTVCANSPVTTLERVYGYLNSWYLRSPPR